MKRSINLPFLFILILFVMTNQSHAELIDRSGRLTYETILDISWLQDAKYAQTSGYDANKDSIRSEALSLIDTLT